MFARLTRLLLAGGKLARRTAVLAALAGAVLAAAPATGAELSWGEQKLLETFESLEQGTMAPAEGRDFCRRYLNAMPSAKTEPLRQLATGLLDIDQSFVGDALCAAMVDLNISGDLQAEQLREIAAGEDEKVQIHQFGKALRAVYFAHMSAQGAPRAGGARP